MSHIAYWARLFEVSTGISSVDRRASASYNFSKLSAPATLCGSKPDTKASCSALPSRELFRKFHAGPVRRVVGGKLVRSPSMLLTGVSS